MLCCFNKPLFDSIKAIKELLHTICLYLFRERLGRVVDLRKKKGYVRGIWESRRIMKAELSVQGVIKDHKDKIVCSGRKKEAIRGSRRISRVIS